MVPDGGVIGPSRRGNLRHLPWPSLVSPFWPVDPVREPGNSMYVTAESDYVAAARRAAMRAALVTGRHVPRGELLAGLVMLGLRLLPTPRPTWAIG